MNLPPQRVATPPTTPLSHKRKEREQFRSFKPPPPRLGSAHATKSTTLLNPSSNSVKQPRLSHDSTPSFKPATTIPAVKPECNDSNLLLAGYMAHEFLSNGSIMGEPFDPARAAAMPIKKSNRSIKPSREAEDRYAEVASLFKTNGTHVPGIVNPTQLASYLKLNL